MAEASFQQTSFIGGEISKSAQGRADLPTYRKCLNVCLNSFPLETEAWTRRPGSRHFGTTRSGQPGRVLAFDLQAASPYTIELTDGFMRFRTGAELVTANDNQNVSAITLGTPASVLTNGAHNWSSGDYVAFVKLGGNNPLLQGREFFITVTGGSTFTIADALNGAPIDGTTLGAFGTGVVRRIKDLGTPYTGGAWSTVRMVQADLLDRSGTAKVGAVFLHASIKPYVLTVDKTPAQSGGYARFSFAAATFKDGPYFDSVAGGALATPSAKLGVIIVTVSFGAYDATKAYANGDYVTYSAANYKSLQDANVGHQPDISATYWVAVGAGDAIGPNGFVTSDIGRHIRLLSEPAIWLVGSTYSAGDVVAYGGAGPRYDGSNLNYWKSLVGSNIGNVPGVDVTKWALFPSGAVWSWGIIRGLTTAVPVATGAAIGNMISGGGNAAAFDGVFSQAASASAERSVVTPAALGSSSLSSFVGKDFSAASNQAVSQVSIYPSSDQGFAFLTPVPSNATITVRLNLRGKATAPAFEADGTILGTSGDIANTTSAVTIISSDQTTTWKYLWVEQVTAIFIPSQPIPPPTLINAIAEVSLVNPSGSGTSTGVSVEIRGDALLYTSSVRTWRLGLYCDTVGWPSCGTYHEGRLFLSGVVPNRWDASVANDQFNFAPTQPSGSVAGNNAISYTFNAPDANPIFWMTPDLQGVVCGTQGGEWLIQATSNNLPITPLTVQAHRVTTNRCANIEPRRSGLTLAAVQAFRRKVLEYFADVFSGKFAAHNLTKDTPHLTKGNIAEIAYQNGLTPILWARRDDGVLVGWTYKRESLVSSQPPDFVGGHPHTLGSGRTVESICVGGNAAGTLDALTMVTEDSITNIRHVEVLTDVHEEGTALANAWFLDNAIAPTSTAEVAVAGGRPYGGLQLNGLWAHNGKTVTVFASGLDCGDFAVTNGSLIVPYGDGVSAGTGAGLFTAAFAASARIVVGFTYNSDGQIVRPASPQETGARTGPALGKKRRIDQYGILVDNTAGLSIGTDFGNLKSVAFKNARGVAQGALATFSGVYSDTLADDYGFDSMICWRVSRPYPATIASVAGKHLKTQD